MQIVHNIPELRKTINERKQQGDRIGFVPTMGNLHQGHLELLDSAASAADFIVVSIFVNPLQFGPGEDLDKYPRTLNEDIEKLQSKGCDLLFAPAVDEIYPDLNANSQDQTRVIVAEIGDILEGASRPGFFTGVATVVTKLFNMVQPDIAVFGEKDYQQLQVIGKLVEDLCLPIKILAHPLVRESNGLAMSSRNGYLDQQQKQQAAFIYQTLSETAERIQQGAQDYKQLEKDAAMQLNNRGFITDYIVIRTPDLKIPDNTSSKLMILAAARLGNVRLIDNIGIIYR